MEKLLVICGPTATGKTRLALHLAKMFKGELISADSRQVYKGMNVGTGKDLAPDAKWHRAKLSFLNSQFSIGFYEVGGVKIWGYDLVEPTREFSVAQYVQIASKIIEDIEKRKKLPILVGGTGLYIKAVVDGIPTSSIPKNESLRRTLKDKSLREQFDLLAQLDPVRAASLNASDRKNSRRLIRAIEIAEYKLKTKDKPFSGTKTRYDAMFIGLNTNSAALSKIIKKRVINRLRKGMEKEMIKLFEKGITFKHQSMQALGYKQWRGYFQNKKSKQKVINSWILVETQYAKRQVTWFKRDKRINWFDVTKPNWKQHVEKMVRKWYKNDIGNW